MKTLETSRIRENQITQNIYKEDPQFEIFLKSIELDGILEPLIVQPHPDEENMYEVISGNRRLRAARELKIEKVPVVIQGATKLTKELVIAYQQYRQKSPSELMEEIIGINKRYGLRQGVRSDLDEKAKKGRELKNILVETHGKSKLDKLTQINKFLDILSNVDPKIREKELKLLDSKGSINGTHNRLRKKVMEFKNKQNVGERYEILEKDFKIYQKSSEDLSDIEDNSVATIITSPPYFDLRNYQLGKGEMGHEGSVEEFVNRLVNHFNDAMRVLKKDGTMWVNLGDYIQGYGYSLVPEKFVMGMIEKGWILHDKIIWVKNNPVFTNSFRCVLANEFIYVFKKNEFVQFDTTWVKDYNRDLGFLTIGGKKLKSVFDFRDNIIYTNSANNSDLRKKCEDKGFFLTHDATFPISIPTIAILTSSKEGDLILDPFSGTATSGQSAKALGRKYIGYELNPTFIKQSEIRMELDRTFVKAA